MHDLRSQAISPLAPERAAYLVWRDSLGGYQNFDTHIDEDQQLRRDLCITAAGEIEWRRRRDAEFHVEF
jgi:hypothetical protein